MREVVGRKGVNMDGMTNQLGLRLYSTSLLSPTMLPLLPVHSWWGCDLAVLGLSP
jgi:hypothetical protein